MIYGYALTLVSMAYLMQKMHEGLKVKIPVRSDEVKGK